MPEDELNIATFAHRSPGDDPYIGQLLGGRYSVSARIGSGGMGTVYEGRQQPIGRRVALKILHKELTDCPETVRRFMNEARAAGMLGHPNIVVPTDMGRTPDGAPFLVLELLEGHNLEQVAIQVGAMSIGRAVRIAQQVCSALAAAHARRIVHRDLKPENVFLVRQAGVSDFVKVLDFGISKMPFGRISGQFKLPPGADDDLLADVLLDPAGAGTRTGSLMGTPHYLSPEQAADASTVDLRTDVYALGVILYRLLAGRVPFRAASVPELIARIVREQAPPLIARRPDVPAPLHEAICRAMAKQREDRFPDMLTLTAALAPFAQHDAAPLLVDANVGGELVSEQLRQRETLDAQGTTLEGDASLSGATAAQGSSPALTQPRRGLARWLSLFRSS